VPALPIRNLNKAHRPNRYPTYHTIYIDTFRVAKTHTMPYLHTFHRKSPMISGSVPERDRQLKAPHASTVLNATLQHLTSVGTAQTLLKRESYKRKISKSGAYDASRVLTRHRESLHPGARVTGLI